MSWAKVHRWLAIVLVALLVVWSITGLLFHLKPGWDRAYDMLSVERGKSEKIETIIGTLTRTNGKLESPISVLDAETLMRDALGRSEQRASYGTCTRVTSDDSTATLQCGHVQIRMDRHTLRISQRGSDTDRIDWLYRIHYLQWTGNATVDKALAVFGLALIWAVMIPGIVLFVRRLRRRA